MSEHLITPIRLEYQGYDAEKSRVDVVQAGKSLAGIGRIYNSLFHFHLHGTLPPRNYRPYLKMYVGPASEGSLVYILTAAVVYDQIAVYPQILFESAEYLIPNFLKAIFYSRSNRNEDMLKALEIIQEQSQQHHDISKTALEGVLSNAQTFSQAISQLAQYNRQPMRDMVAPVATRSCRTIKHYAGTPYETTIDPPLADVMRSKEDLEVGISQTYNVIVLGVDSVTCSCRVQLTDTGQVVRGRITDPMLSQAHNPYTASLDNHSVVTVTAKPIIKDGEIERVYISDAPR